MSDAKLLVTISGSCAAGKTTLALAFAEFLREKGFTDVVVEDEDVTRGTHIPQVQDQRLTAISDRHVSIMTIQLGRNK